MDELINYIIELLFLFKYGQFFNKNKSFIKELEQSVYLSDHRVSELNEIVKSELNSLIVKVSGTPKYVLFTHMNHGWYQVMVVNEEKKFCCRLKNKELSSIITENSCYISL